MTQLELAAIRTRIASAKSRLNDLEEEIDGFLSGKPPYDVYVEPTDEVGIFAVRVRVRRNPPLEWGVAVGDVAHGLRSALNELVTQLVRAHGNEPRRSNQFPIFTDQRAYWGKQRGKKRSRRDESLAGVGPKSRKLIDGVQPFGRVPKSMHLDSFAQLQWLNNQDKHVELHPGFVKASKWGFGAKHPKDVPIPKMEIRLARTDVRGPMEDGELLAKVGWSGQAGVLPSVDEITCEVGFGDRGVILSEIDRMILTIGRFVDRMADLDGA